MADSQRPQTELVFTIQRFAGPGAGQVQSHHLPFLLAGASMAAGTDTPQGIGMQRIHLG